MSLKGFKHMSGTWWTPYNVGFTTKIFTVCFQSKLMCRHDKKSFSSKAKTAILMLNMGGPGSQEEVKPFLTRLFMDKDIISLPMQNVLGPWIVYRRTPSVAAKYREIGGSSPILSWTQKQGQMMTNLLDKISPNTAPHKHYVGFRYANPLMEDSLEQIEKDGAEMAVAFSQYPQYSCSTSGSSFNALYRYYKDRQTNIQWRFIDRWPTHPKLVECFADLITLELQKLPENVRKKMILLFSAHALPMKVVNNGDPYPTEVAATVLAVMEKLHFAYPYRLVWQSKVGPLPWLSPQTDSAMQGLVANGHKHLMIVPISFVNEHIETLHELDIEYGQELAEKIGVETFRRVPAPNDHPAFIQCLADVVRSSLCSGRVCNPQLLLRCPLCTKDSCLHTKQWISAQ